MKTNVCIVLAALVLQAGCGDSGHSQLDCTNQPTEEAKAAPAVGADELRPATLPDGYARDDPSAPADRSQAEVDDDRTVPPTPTDVRAVEPGEAADDTDRTEPARRDNFDLIEELLSQYDRP